MMPNLNGCQLIDILRGDDCLMTIPIVVISASVGNIVLPVGVRFMKKPALIDDLIRAVEEHCGPRATTP